MKAIGRWRELLESCYLDPMTQSSILKWERGKIILSATTMKVALRYSSLLVSCGLAEWTLMPREKAASRRRYYQESVNNRKGVQGGGAGVQLSGTVHS